jgi:rubrerythrin
MSVSFIFNNLAFFYRIDSFNRDLPVIAWKCKSLPVQGEAQSKEHMYEQIKSRLKQYYRNRPVPVPCDTCGLTSPKMEAQSTCPECLIDNE